MRQQKEQTPLQELVNAPEVVKAFGRSYEIRKFSFYMMTQALEYVGVIGYVLQMLNEMPKDKKGRVVADPNAILSLATRAISVMGPSVFGIVSVATKEPIEWLQDDERDAMDGLRLFAKVVEKNLDFFSQTNIDEMTKMFDGLQGQIPKIGGDTATT